MAKNPSQFREEPAEGSREVIERELARTHPEAEKTSTESFARPGDEAPPGTPGTGEDTCPQCQASGVVNGQPCRNCAGTGRIIKAIGGA